MVELVEASTVDDEDDPLLPSVVVDAGTAELAVVVDEEELLEASVVDGVEPPHAVKIIVSTATVPRCRKALRLVRLVDIIFHLIFWFRYACESSNSGSSNSRLCAG